MVDEPRFCEYGLQRSVINLNNMQELVIHKPKFPDVIQLRAV